MESWNQVTYKLLDALQNWSEFCCSELVKDKSFLDKRLDLEFKLAGALLHWAHYTQMFIYTFDPRLPYPIRRPGDRQIECIFSPQLGINALRMVYDVILLKKQAEPVSTLLAYCRTNKIMTTEGLGNRLVVKHKYQEIGSENQVFIHLMLKIINSITYDFKLNQDLSKSHKFIELTFQLAVRLTYLDALMNCDTFDQLVAIDLPYYNFTINWAVIGRFWIRIGQQIHRRHYHMPLLPFTQPDY